MNTIVLVNHNILGDIMVYFFSNIIMYLIILIILIFYFSKRINIYSFLLLLVNINLYTIFLYLKLNFIYGTILAIITVLIYKFSSLFNKNQEEIILIKEGNILFKEAINNYGLKKLINYLKIRNIKLENIAYCIKKDNRLIIIKNNEIKGFPINIIIDGNILEENLKIIKKDREWLARELLNNKLLVKNVDYAYYKNNNIYFVK